MNELQALTLIERFIHIALILYITYRVLVLYKLKAISKEYIFPILVLLVHVFIYTIFSLVTLDLGILPIFSYHGTWAGAMITHTLIVIVHYITVYMRSVGLVK